MLDDERALLSTALRARPATVAELADLCRLSPRRVRELLDGLDREGLLHREGDDIHYHHPHRQLTERIARIAARAEAGIHADLAELRGLLGELPDLVDDWSLGARVDDHSLQVEVLHGLAAGNELWRRQLRRGVPSVARAVLPDLQYFVVPTPENQESQARFLQSMAVPARTASAVISTADARHPSIQHQLQRFRDAGMEFRMHPRPPSWFWVHDDRVVAIPLTWGDAWPSSVMAIHSKPIAAILTDAFERLWYESVPALHAEYSWDPLLRLMRSGATLDAASRALGIASRTGRRRIAAAMKHYGTRTLFGLGAAWAEGGGSSASASAPDEPLGLSEAAVG